MTRFKFYAIGCLLLVASSCVRLTASDATTDDERARPLPTISWDTTIEHFQFDHDKFIGQRLTVVCPPMPREQDLSGLWGSSVYPSQSSICLAAMHSGVLTREGGVVQVQLNPGIEKYKGSQQNGIDSGDLPKTSRSIMILSAENLEEADRIREPYLPHLDWDKRFTQTGLANRKLTGQRFTFRLSAKPNDRKARLVFGTDIYAFSSPVGWAALHAGSLKATGGIVTVEIAPEASPLIGSIRNGLESKSKNGDSRTLTFVN